ncbi:hypothetical protein KC217_24440, partial [Mycobacterium tuberculosis]|nr:hypothetical protein [Mycobacterium tuberculosis]
MQTRKILAIYSQESDNDNTKARTDLPISLSTAVQLPELGGSVGNPSPFLSERKLRAAIDRGDLVCERHGSR